MNCINTTCQAHSDWVYGLVEKTMSLTHHTCHALQVPEAELVALQRVQSEETDDSSSWETWPQVRCSAPGITSTHFAE